MRSIQWNHVATGGMCNHSDPVDSDERWTRGRGIIYTKPMIFPLQELIEYEDNMYEITCASSRRAFQLSMLRDPEIEEHEGKVVSLAAQQVFTKEIEFRIEESQTS